MTYEDFSAEVDKTITTLEAIRDFPISGFGDTNISLAACEAAAAITGFDATFCKMLNRKFRTAAARVALERAA